MNKVLTIAGSDCSGGAGIQADLKTFAGFKQYGMSVITAITAQNTTGVREVYSIPDATVKNQLDAVMEDIFPDAIKIGMVSQQGTIDVIVDCIKKYGCKNVVVDPVMVSTSGCKLLDDDAIYAVKSRLFSVADVITPNLYEGEIISGIKIETKEDMVKACDVISKFYTGYILLKGGHLKDSCDDLLYHNGNSLWITGQRINSDNTHGTGCTLSSAIAAGLAKGQSMEDSVRNAKAFVFAALKDSLNLGKGNGPLNHNIVFLGDE